MITKEELRRRLLVAKYPRRADADLSSAPDHNPLVLEDCPTCRGTGGTCEGGPGFATLLVCPDCHGDGTTYAVVPRFTNASPPVVVRVEADGWVTCPVCDRRFSPTDKGVWTGFRHIRCGQRLRLETMPAAR